MRLSLRFIVPLPVVLAAFAYAVLPLVDGLTVRWFMHDRDIGADPASRGTSWRARMASLGPADVPEHVRPTLRSLDSVFLGQAARLVDMIPER